MSRPRKFSPEQLDMVRADYTSSGSFREVGRMWGVDGETINSLLNPEHREKRLVEQTTKRRKSRPRPERLDPPEKVLFWGAKKRAREYSVPIDILPDDIVVPTICPILGIPLVYGARTGKPQAGSPSLDRIKPELGYTKGNIRVVSFRANTLKSDATLAELELVLEDLKGFSKRGYV